MNNQKLNMINHFKHDLSEFNGYKYITPKGYFKRHNIEHDLRNYNSKLIRVLLNDDLIRSTYVKSIDGVNILKIDQLIDLMTYSSYLPDSYTKYADVTGLAVGNNYLSDNSNVVLNFPYKDTVLEGGMTNEHQKNDNEPFLNNVIAKPEIDELFEPKILSNVYKYDVNGKHHANKITDTDNLMIKGNNLIALYSLLPRYAGKVKLIYIDPPYNTGKDSFNYNDTFNQSAWLVFMENRLKVAKRLLKDNGSLWISIDSNESHYLKVLTDEIFGRENFIDEITWQRAYAPINLKKTVSRSTDSILIYAKKFNSDFSFNRLPRNASQNNRYKNPDHDFRGPWKSDNLSVGPAIKKNIYTITTPSGRKVTPPSGYSWRLSKPRFKQFKKHKRIWFGKDGDNVPSIKRFLSEVRGVVAQTLWLHKDVGDNQDGKRELKKLFGKDVFSTPKPEKLMQRIIHMATNPGDIVLDFFSGSATTQAVAMKMNRRFIGVEQMDYIDTVSVPRLQKVINGEQGGISKAVKWQGGGNFIYAKLMTKNQKFVNKVKNSQSINELKRIFIMMRSHADFNLGAKLNKCQNILNDPNTSLQNKKDMLIGTLDVNQSYYNAHNIDDSNVRKKLSDNDYQFNKSFYDK